MLEYSYPSSSRVFIKTLMLGLLLSTVLGFQKDSQSVRANDRTYRIKHIGLCLFLLIFCQTKSDSQHRFTNHPVQLFFSDM